MRASKTAFKDIAEAHRAGIDVRELLEKLRTEAPTYAELAQQRRAAQLPDLQEAAQEVLDAADPLELVRDALTATYGGDLNAPLLIYLAASTRLLAVGLGSMPCHVLVVGTGQHRQELHRLGGPRPAPPRGQTHDRRRLTARADLR